MHRMRGPLLVLLSRLSALALLYSLLRLLFVLFNRDAFPNVPAAAYIGGVRFDLFAIAWLNLPWVMLCLINSTETGWFARFKLIVFLVLNAAGFFFACTDLEYYKFTLKRSTADLFGIMAGGGDTGSLATVFASDYWYIILLFLACLSLAWLAYRRSARLQANAPLSPTRSIAWRVAAMALLVLFARGGVQLMPIGVMNAGDHVPPPYYAVVLNTPFTIMTSIGKPVVEEETFMPKEEADRLWPVEHRYVPARFSSDSLALGIPKLPLKPNVVVIILESFSAAYSAHLSGGDGYMPFLDSLMAQSMNFSRAYANGRRSIDGIPAITASMPELMDEAFITSTYAQTPFTSLASVLAKDGYATSFYHGGRNGTMGFDGFTKSAGYARYVGMNEYPDQKDYDGAWGIWDRPFLKFFAQQLSMEPEPFHSTVFTLSSHHPYRLLPEDAARFSGGPLRIHASLQYADDALRGFFATASQQPWFDRTLFVITADHTADIDRNGQHYSEATDYHVPLVYYMPSAIKGDEIERVTQHIDIMPTVLDLIGHQEPFFSFGSSALRNERAAVAVTKTTGRYLIIDSEGALSFAADKPDEQHVHSPVVRTMELERTMQAAIQQFNNRMLRNQLMVP